MSSAPRLPSQRRFRIAPALLTGWPIALPPEVAHQVSRALRLKESDEVGLLDGRALRSSHDVPARRSRTRSTSAGCRMTAPSHVYG